MTVVQATQKPPVLPAYQVLGAFVLGGRKHAPGETVRMSPRQAVFLVSGCKVALAASSPADKPHGIDNKKEKAQ